ncbi:MAG: histidine phosphatase family protein [Solirubrobacteraceae bacterium]|nr:histidine phosphatase family protein [Solirubrobacteraceae bacterium]
MSVVLLVRHGQANFGLGNYDKLSEHGQAQALRLAEVLAGRGQTVDRIISGDLDRQRETAKVLSSVLGGGRTVTVDPRWNEYDHTRLIARVKPMYKKQWVMVADLARAKHPHRRLQEILDESLARWVSDGDLPAVHADAEAPEPDVESFAAYSERIAGALDQVSSEQGTSLVVSSAGTIAAAIAPLLGVPARAWPDLQRVMVNSSVTKVVRGQRGISLISFNEHSHLEGVPGLKITYR